MGRSVKNFCKRVYFRRRCRYKDGAHTENNLLEIVFSQILLAGRLTRSYFNVDTVHLKLLQIAFKMLIYHC